MSKIYQASFCHSEFITECTREEFETTKELLIKAAKNDLPWLSLHGRGSVDIFNFVHNPIMQMRIEQDNLIAFTKTHIIKMSIKTDAADQK